MEHELIELGAKSLKKAALNEEAKEFLLKNEKLFNVFKRAAKRYVCGETAQDALKLVHHWNEKGFSVTTDFMGESIRNEKEANDATQEFIKFAKLTREKGLKSSISLDLSHIGLLVSKELTMKNLSAICKEAEAIQQEVVLSMEGTNRTDDILDIYKETLKTHKNLGITVQAYLYRTKDDLKELSKLSGSIRMVKGAFATPKGHSIERGTKLDSIYLEYIEQLLIKDHPCSIASHHEKMFEETTRIIDKCQPSNYVLERLLGIGNDQLEHYKNKGYRCRIYLVYGKEWYLYLCNRWAEYPLNIFQGIADMVDGNDKNIIK